MRRESLVCEGFQRFSALEALCFLTMFTDFSFDESSTYWQGGSNRLTPLRTLKRKNVRVYEAIWELDLQAFLRV